ncbi:MAG: DUF3054 domain-containing protein [Micrococcaceae bacterium]
MNKLDKIYAQGFLLDILCVLAFVLIGEREHDSQSSFLYFFKTFAPFGAALCASWCVALLLKYSPFRILPFGVIIWLGTVVLGHIFRVLLGGTTAVSFIIVSTIFLGIFLLGWRLVLQYLNNKKVRETEQ